MTDSKVKTILEQIQMPYRKGENIDELVRYRLSNILPYKKDEFYFKYAITGKQLKVHYAKEKESGLAIMEAEGLCRKRNVYAMLIVVLSVLLITNRLILKYKQNTFRKYFKHRIYQTNQLYHNKDRIIRYKRIKKRNLKKIDLLQHVIMLPIHIQYLNVKNNNFEIHGFSKEIPSAELISRLTEIGLSPRIQYAMQEDITYLYIRGAL